MLAILRRAIENPNEPECCKPAHMDEMQRLVDAMNSGDAFRLKRIFRRHET